MDNSPNTDARSELLKPNTDLFSDRLKLAMDGESTNSFAKKCEMGESTLRGYLSGSIPSLDKACHIANVAGVSLVWLATGKGPMRPGDSELSVNESDYAYIPLYDAECSAGHGSWNEGCRVLTQISFTKYSLRKQGLDPKALSAIRVDGDSMEGVISDGDAVLIDHSKQEIRGEGIYVLRLDGHLYAKRLQRQFDGVSIISENKAYDTIMLPNDRLDELDIIGQVVWSGGWKN